MSETQWSLTASGEVANNERRNETANERMWDEGKTQRSRTK